MRSFVSHRLYDYIRNNMYGKTGYSIASHTPRLAKKALATGWQSHSTWPRLQCMKVESWTKCQSFAYEQRARAHSHSLALIVLTLSPGASLLLLSTLPVFPSFPQLDCFLFLSATLPRAVVHSSFPLLCFVRQFSKWVFAQQTPNRAVIAAQCSHMTTCAVY